MKGGRSRGAGERATLERPPHHGTLPAFLIIIHFNVILILGRLRPWGGSPQARRISRSHCPHDALLQGVSYYNDIYRCRMAIL